MSATVAVDIRLLLISFWVATILIGFLIGWAIGFVSAGIGK